MRRRIAPIPKIALIHSIEYKEKQSDDGWDPVEAEPTPINNVRVELKTSFIRTSTGKGEQYNALVFVDRVNSSQFPDFVAGSTIIFEGKEYELKDTNPIYDFGPLPHHYELGLV